MTTDRHRTGVGQTEVGQTDVGHARSVTDLLAGSCHIAMLMTMVDGEHTSRPVTCVDVRDHRLSFLVSRTAAWVTDIQANRALVHLTIADQTENTYVALNGTAIVVHDDSEIVRLWNPAARVFFVGPEDPDLAVLHFDVGGGEYWDGPNGRIGRTVALIRAAVTGDDDDIGSTATTGTVLGTENS